MVAWQAALGAGIWACVAAAVAEPAAPVDAGVIVQPPDVDRKADKPAPNKVDPEIAVPAAQDDRKQGPAAQRKRSKQADCKGPAELCRQSRPK